MGVREYLETPPFWLRAFLWLCGLGGGLLSLGTGLWQISTRKTIPEFWADYGWQGVSPSTLEGIVLVVVGLAVLLAVTRQARRPVLVGGNQIEELRRDLGVTVDDVREQCAYELLDWCSQMTFTSPGPSRPIVEIRSAAYGGDYDLVMNIKYIVEQRLHWSVELDATNEPMLPQASEFKVLFETKDRTRLFETVMRAFGAGNLLGVPIGRAFSDSEETHRLKVLPSGD